MEKLLRGLGRIIGLHPSRWTHARSVQGYQKTPEETQAIALQRATKAVERTERDYWLAVADCVTSYGHVQKILDGASHRETAKRIHHESRR
jgi:non-canonical (house-cleaning) NTP pyrophosphatase